MKYTDLFPTWASILRGRKPFLSIEITRECPLRCPGCYAYEPAHLGEAGPLRQLSDFRGEALVSGVLALVRRLRPVHISIVGGEPLVRFRELSMILPKLNEMRIEVQLVTSAVRPIPSEWKDLPNLHLSVSIDGLQPEHDKRRAPATYERILSNIAGHLVIVHCTITRQLIQRPNYLRDFARFWSERPEIRKIWFSLFTPQKGQQYEERLTLQDRIAVAKELIQIRALFPKVEMPDSVLDGYLNPPRSPNECLFSQTTSCISADLTTKIEPCQFGGEPACEECGCMASAAFGSVGKYKLAGVLPLSNIFWASKRVGDRFQQPIESSSELENTYDRS
jgi:MoaA/NifB/PqqE/SkfB family radical SAM enzyme